MYAASPLACVVGSPAHAGIDLIPVMNGQIPQGFPRTRGDRPFFPVAPLALFWVPPHTRG